MTREEAIKILRKEIECLSHTKCEDCILEAVCDPIMTTPFDSEYIEVYEMAIEALEQEPKWIPIKIRPLTNEEKEEYADLGYSEDSINFMYDCPLPEDGEEVLITTRYDEVRTDTFYRDDGCYFETYYDEDDVKAWMPLPKPYKAESEDKE